MNNTTSINKLLMAAIMMAVSVPVMASSNDTHTRQYVKKSEPHNSRRAREHRRDGVRHERRGSRDHRANRYSRKHQADPHYRQRYFRDHGRRYYPRHSYSTGLWYNISPYYSYSYTH